MTPEQLETALAKYRPEDREKLRAAYLAKQAKPTPAPGAGAPVATKPTAPAPPPTPADAVAPQQAPKPRQPPAPKPKVDSAWDILRPKKPVPKPEPEPAPAAEAAPVYAAEKIAETIPTAQVPKYQLLDNPYLPGFNPVRAGINAALDTFGPTRDATEEEMLTLGRKSAADLSGRGAAARLEEIRSVTGREPTPEEVEAAHAEALADVEQVGLGTRRVSPFRNEPGVATREEISVGPGEAPDGRDLNPYTAISALRNEYEKKALRDWTAANPDGDISSEEYLAIARDAQDRARRAVLGTVGYDQGRQNPLVPLDGVQAQIDRVRQGRTGLAQYTPMIVAHRLLTEAAGGNFEDTYLSKSMSPFWATLTPGFTEAELVDPSGKRLGAASKESWISSFIRPEFTTPGFVYAFDESIPWDGWGSDQHLRKISEGADPTWYATRVGKQLAKLTPWEDSPLMTGAMGVSAIAPVLLFDPDLPSLATLGGSEALKLGRAARVVLDDIAIARAAEAAKAIENGADLGNYAEGVRAAGSFERNLVEHVEAEARLELAARGATSAAGDMDVAGKHSEVLARAEAEVASLRADIERTKGAASNAKRQVGRDVGGLVGDQMELARRELAAQDALRGAADETIKRRMLWAEDLKDAARVDDVAAEKALGEAGTAVGAERATGAARVAEKKLVAEAAAEDADTATALGALADDISTRVESTLRVLNGVRAEAKAATARSAEALQALRQAVGRPVDPTTIDALWEASVKGKAESDKITKQLAKYGATDLESIQEILRHGSKAYEETYDTAQAAYKKMGVLKAELDRLGALGKEATEVDARRMGYISDMLGKQEAKFTAAVERGKDLGLKAEAFYKKYGETYRGKNTIQVVSGLLKRQAELNRARFINASDLDVVGAYEAWKGVRATSGPLLAKIDTLRAELKALTEGVPSANAGWSRAEAAGKVWERAEAAAVREAASAAEAVRKAEAALAAAINREAGRVGPAAEVAAEVMAATKKRLGKIREALDASKVRAKKADEALRAVTDNPVREALKRASTAKNINVYTSLLDDIYGKQQKLGGKESELANIAEYRNILARKWRGAGESFQAAKTYHKTGKMAVDTGAKAEILLNKTARMANDQVNAVSRQLLGQKEPFTYGFRTGLGLQADVSRFFALVKLRGGDMMGRAFDVVAARGFGVLSQDLKLAAGRGFGRYNGMLHEGNEIARLETKAREEGDRVYKNLLNERATASPARRVDIDAEILRLEQAMVGNERDYLVTTRAIPIGEGRATVMNRNQSPADNCLSYLKMVLRGVEDNVELTREGAFMGLVRAWLPPGITGKAIEGDVIKLVREIVFESETGEAFVAKLMNTPKADFMREYAKLESPMRAWGHIRDAIYAGAATHDTVWDVIRTAGPRLTADDAAVFDFLAEPGRKDLAKVGRAGMDVSEVEKKLVAWGMSFKKESVARFDAISFRYLLSGNEQAQRLVRLGIEAGKDGAHVYLPEHVLEAIRAIPSRTAKEATQASKQESPWTQAARRMSAALRVTWLYGLKFPHFRQFVMQPWSDFTSMAPLIGAGNAARITLKNGVGLIPVIGATAEKAIEALGTKSLLARSGSVELSRVLAGDPKYLVEVAEGRVPADQILREAIESRLWSGLNTEAMDGIAQRTFSGLGEKGLLGKAWDFATTPSDLTRRMVDALEEAQFRQRLALFVELRTGRIGGAKLSRDAAEKAALEATFDWTLSQLPWERDTIGLFTMFWAYNRVSWRQTIGIATEALTMPGEEYLRKAVVGRTKLGKTISMAQVAQTAKNTATTEDDAKLDDYGQAMEVGRNSLPWYVTAAEVVTRDPVSTARALWYTSSGKPVTHEMWALSSAQWTDNLYRMFVMANAATATAHAGYEVAGGRPGTTHAPLHKVWGDVAALLTNFVHPYFEQTLDYGLSLADSGRPPDITIPRDDTVTLNMLKRWGVEAPFLEQKGDKYVLEGAAGAALSILLAAVPGWKDFSRSYATYLDNPGYSDGVANGIVEAIIGSFGIRAKGYAPLEDDNWEVRGEKSSLKSESKNVKATK